VIRDGGEIALVGGLGAGSCLSSAGMEIGLPSGFSLSNFKGDTFDQNTLEYRNTGGSWNCWSSNSAWNDIPCGAGFYIPNCMNGTFYNPHYWASNKPN
jgi:hypothetical protein